MQVLCNRAQNLRMRIYRARTRQVFAFPPFSPPTSPMTIKKRVFVAIMEGKLELGLGLGLSCGLELGLAGYESGPGCIKPVLKYSLK